MDVTIDQIREAGNVENIVPQENGAVTIETFTYTSNTVSISDLEAQISLLQDQKRISDDSYDSKIAEIQAKINSLTS